MSDLCRPNLPQSAREENRVERLSGNRRDVPPNVERH